MQIYICLGLALAVMAGVVFISLAPQKQIKLTLDNVIDESTPKKRQKSTRRPDAPPAEDPKTLKGEEDKEVDSFKKEILYKTIDENGPYPRSHGVGPVEPEAFCRLHRTIMRHSYLLLIEFKEELFKERIEHIKNGRMNEYA